MSPRTKSQKLTWLALIVKGIFLNFLEVLVIRRSMVSKEEKVGIRGFPPFAFFDLKRGIWRSFHFQVIENIFDNSDKIARFQLILH